MSQVVADALKAALPHAKIDVVDASVKAVFITVPHKLSIVQLERLQTLLRPFEARLNIPFIVVDNGMRVTLER